MKKLRKKGPTGGMQGGEKGKRDGSKRSVFWRGGGGKRGERIGGTGDGWGGKGARALLLLGGC